MLGLLMKDDEEFALLLEGANKVEADLAKNLLDEAGIPSMAQGPDFDIAELGHAVHDMIRGLDVYVPRAALERAQEILAAAWDGPGKEPSDSGAQDQA